jgi:hypothetical protein
MTRSVTAGWHGARDAFTRWNRPVSPLTRVALNAALVALVVAAALLWFYANITYYNAPDNGMEPFTDVNTYLAAGERLNAGHDLYRLQPGDRPVLPWPGLYKAPLLSPPPIAVFWRPLAAVDWGPIAWIVATWAVLWATILVLVFRAGLWAVFLAIALSHAIGEQLAVGNANAFAPAVYLLMWRFRDRAWIGVLIAALASVKLAPIAMAGWLIGTRRWTALAVTAIAGVAIFLIGGLGAGFGSYIDYVGTLGSNNPTSLSVSGQTHIPWASYAFLAGGALVAIAIGRRYPTASWAVALLASVLGTPALYASGLVSLLALAAPLVSPARALSWRRAPGPTRQTAAPLVRAENP